MQESSSYLFVYGTLRLGGSAELRRFLPACCEFLDHGELQGHLYEVAGYPGVVQSDNPGEWVKGELYRLSDPREVLAKLDEYEECSSSFARPHEYVRKQLPVERGAGGRVMAWVYLYNRDSAKLQRITSGDYLQDQAIRQG